MINLADERIKKGYRQQDVADKVGISKGGYCNIEKRRYLPTVKTAKKIADVLGIDWREIYE